MCRGEVAVRDRECDVAFCGNKGIGAFRGVPDPETRVASFRAETRASVDARTFAGAADAAVAVLEGRVVERATRCETSGKWRLLVAARDAKSGGFRDVDDTDVLEADFVWAACGETVDASRDPVLKRLSDREDAAGRFVGGFPVLVEDDDASDAEGGRSVPLSVVCVVHVATFSFSRLRSPLSCPAPRPRLASLPEFRPRYARREFETETRTLLLSLHFTSNLCAK